MSTPPPPPPAAAGKTALDKLIKYKYYLAVGLAITAIIASLLSLSPRLVDVLRFFLPLLLSTAMFVVTVVVFSKAALPIAGEDNCLNAGAELLDYVAGQNDPVLENLKPE